MKDNGIKCIYFVFILIFLTHSPKHFAADCLIPSQEDFELMSIAELNELILNLKDRHKFTVNLTYRYIENANKYLRLEITDKHLNFDEASWSEAKDVLNRGDFDYSDVSIDGFLEFLNGEIQYLESLSDVVYAFNLNVSDALKQLISDLHQNMLAIEADLNTIKVSKARIDQLHENGI